MNPGGLPILVGQGAGAGLGVNAGALAVLFAWVAFRNPQNPVQSLITKDAHWLVGTGLIGGVLLGGLVGAGLWSVWRVAGPARWAWLTPLGFPIGGLVGVLQGVTHALTLGASEKDLAAFATIGGLGGGASVGLLWPVALILRAAGRPAWAVLVLAPMVSAAVCGLALGAVVWAGR